MVNARLLCLPACLPILLLPGPALAWSDLGHRIICEIAFQELDPIARERVKAMIRRDPEFDTSPIPAAGQTIPGVGRRSTT